MFDCDLYTKILTSAEDRMYNDISTGGKTQREVDQSVGRIIAMTALLNKSTGELYDNMLSNVDKIYKLNNKDKEVSNNGK